MFSPIKLCEVMEKAAAGFCANSQIQTDFNMGSQTELSVDGYSSFETKNYTCTEALKEYILPDSNVYTDHYPAYVGRDKINGYQHRRINHSAGVYVVGDTHAQTIEGFWSLVKTGIGGVCHSVSKKYLQTYQDEYSFRYNRRAAGEPIVISPLAEVSE